MTPAPGVLVTPSVKLLEPLRSGGMASVWVAEHLTLHTRVVVKFISEMLAGNEEALTRFAREASAAAAVKSPHVVQVFDHGVIDGSPFIVMELLEGEDLRTRIERGGALPLYEVEAIVSQTCKALATAHRVGVVHRDIKPDNMFLCRGEDGDVFVKLLDFGIAKKEESGAMSATRTGSVMGTPYYMSPEQVIGLKTIDLRTDIWSLGVVAFEAMTGVKAFNGETLGALAVAVTHGPMPIPSRINPLLPPAIDEWFARACARDPAQRFPTAKDMSYALRTITTGGPATASGSLPRLSATSPLLMATPGVAHMATTPMPQMNRASSTTLPLTNTTSPMVQQPVDAPPMSSASPALLVGVVAGGLLLLALGGGAFFLMRSGDHAGKTETQTTPAGLVTPAASTPNEGTTVVTVPAIQPQTANVEPPPATSTTSKPATHVATPPHVVTKPDTTHPATTKPNTGSKPDCTTPYYYNASGDKVFKPECVE